jgi:hypothetical protein
VYAVICDAVLLGALRSHFERFTSNLVVLYGGMGAPERRAAQDGLKRPDTEERISYWPPAATSAKASTTPPSIRCS